jgi:hypothetical protein
VDFCNSSFAYCNRSGPSDELSVTPRPLFRRLCTAVDEIFEESDCYFILYLTLKK